MCASVPACAGAGAGGPLLGPWWVMDGRGQPGRDHCLANEVWLPRRGSPICFYCSHSSLRNSYPPQSLKKICVRILSFLGGGAPLSQYPTPPPETESYLLVTGASPPLLLLGNLPTPYSPNFMISVPRQFNTTCCLVNASLNHQVTKMPALRSQCGAERHLE